MRTTRQFVCVWQDGDHPAECVCVCVCMRTTRQFVCVWQDGDHPAKFSHPQPTAWWGEQESLAHLTINLLRARRGPGPRYILG